jgi:DNA-binding HxlR family transcriptional regulator
MSMRDKTRSGCPAEVTLAVINGTWKVPILYHLAKGTRRFSELRNDIGGVTQKVLIQQLRDLEREGIVSRKVYPQVPPKVEYSLTPAGRTLLPIVKVMCDWGAKRRRAQP